MKRAKETKKFSTENSGNQISTLYDKTIQNMYLFPFLSLVDQFKSENIKGHLLLYFSYKRNKMSKDVFYFLNFEIR